MNAYQKILGITLLTLVLITPVFAVGDSANLVLTTKVGETLENSGIRITLDDEDINTAANFDNKFFSANSMITIDNTDKDSSIDDIEGAFSILVRRNNDNNLRVTVVANPLVNGNNYLAYTLTSTSDFAQGASNPFTVEGTASNSREYYITKSAQEPITRHQNIFTYSIPADNNAPMGTYSASIVFELETT